MSSLGRLWIENGLIPCVVGNKGGNRSKDSFPGS